jgi:hypothetical protein
MFSDYSALIHVEITRCRIVRPTIEDKYLAQPLQCELLCTISSLVVQSISYRLHSHLISHLKSHLFSISYFSSPRISPVAQFRKVAAFALQVLFLWSTVSHDLVSRDLVSRGIASISSKIRTRTSPSQIVARKGSSRVMFCSLEYKDCAP